MEEEFCFSDFYQISYKTSEDWAWFIETLDKLNYKEHIKIEQKILPAPIDILINEFEPNRHLEYRDILGPEKSVQDNIAIFQKYLQWICPKDNNLIIVDRYFFNSLVVNADMVKKIFNQVSVKTIKVITENKNFNKKDYYFFKSIFGDKKIEITYNFADKLHGRFYLSNSGKGFSCGTSLNGIMLRENDIHSLLDSDYKVLYEKYNSL